MNKKTSIWILMALGVAVLGTGIVLRFGLHNGVEHTQKQVADMLGISQSYISRLEKRIIRRLQKEVSMLG